MTRSVEIPDAAVEAAVDVLMDYGHNGLQCDPTPNFSTPVRRALEAALPYLAPAETLNYDSVFRVLHEASGCVCDGTVGWHIGDAHRRHIVQYHKMTQAVLELTPAPAGDGGLREALERMLTEPRGTYDLSETGRSYNEGVEQIRREVRGLLAAHPAVPAVPQPVDREALRDAVQSAISSKTFTMLGDGDPVCGVMAATDAVLAVLAGEQEQVERS